MGKKALRLSDYTQPVLADAVKHFAQRLKLSGSSGDWAAFVQALPASSRNREPYRHDAADLCTFLESLLQGAEVESTADERRKMMRRYLKWAARVRQEEATQPQPCHLGRTVHPKHCAHGRQLETQQALMPADGGGSSGPVTSCSGATPPAGAECSAGCSAPGAADEGVSSEAIWWLVERCRRHPTYATKYSFPSYEKGWRRIPRWAPGPEAGGQPPPQQLDGQGRQQPGQQQQQQQAVPLAQWPRPQLLALDCEMCVTDCDASALLAVCVVDEAGGVVLQELVRPKGSILDLKTSVTGISAADLAAAPRLARRRALAADLGQRIAAAAARGAPTVLIGHSLHADLAALHLDHTPVIDTALLFSYQGLERCAPSLTDLCALMLGRSLRGADGGAPHDSREDACAALALAMHEARRFPGPATPPLVPPVMQVPKYMLRRLMVHGIPAGTATADILAAFQAAAGKAPDAAELPGSGGGETGGGDAVGFAPEAVLGGKLLLVFGNPAAADGAFSALPSGCGRDSAGRQCKKLRLGADGPGASVKVTVRKMACHNGRAFGKDAARDRGAVKSAAGSRRRPSARHADRKRARHQAEGVEASNLPKECSAAWKRSRTRG